MAKLAPPFKTDLGLTQDVTDIGRYTIGMENPLGRELKEQLGEDTSEEILKWIEGGGLATLGYQGGKGARHIGRKFTDKGRKKLKEAKRKAELKRIGKAFIRNVAKKTAGGVAKRGLLAATGVGAPVVAGLSILDLLSDPEIRQGGLDIMRLYPELWKTLPSGLEEEARYMATDRDKQAQPYIEGGVDMDAMIENLASKEGIRKESLDEIYKRKLSAMPSALERERMQMNRAKERNAGLQSLLKGSLN